jgi:hypothetical protein
VPWVALKLTEPTWIAKDFSALLLFVLLIPIGAILLLELWAAYCTWLGTVRLQRNWPHVLDGEWHAGDPQLSLSLGGGHADVSLVGYVPPAGKAPKRSPQWSINSSLASYRQTTPVDGRHELGDVTGAVWGGGTPSCSWAGGRGCSIRRQACAYALRGPASPPRCP